MLLLGGSFGQTWFNTLLPSGFTLDWYLQVATDGSFRRAFWTSLQVCILTCTVCAFAGTPLAYAIYRAASQKVRAAARSGHCVGSRRDQIARPGMLRSR
jgi:putative spermidine/putrescine transport system permease protein